MRERSFKTFNDAPIEDLDAYINDYIDEHPETVVLIGSDSQVRTRRIVFATAVCLYRPGSGAHVLYTRSTQEKHSMNSLHQRLMVEVSDTIALALRLRDKITRPISLEVHFDISPDSQHQSNVAYGSAVSYAKGSDLDVKTKPAAASFAASCVADRLC